MNMTFKEAFATWSADIKPAVIQQYGRDDYTALAESWNDYTDSLCKDGKLSDLQYQYCPAWDDEFPDDEHAYILESMGVSFAELRISERPDGLMSDMAGASHWRILIKRGKNEMTVFYSMGPAHKGAPNGTDVFHSLLADTDEIHYGYDFEEWADILGFNTDSRQAERMFQACQDEFLHLKTLFSDSELNDLRELFRDY